MIKILLSEAFFNATHEFLNTSPLALNLYIQNFSNKCITRLSHQISGAFKFCIHNFLYKGIRNHDYLNPVTPFSITNEIISIVQKVKSPSFYLPTFKKIPKHLNSTNEKLPSIFSIIKKNTRGALINYDQNLPFPRDNIDNLPPDPSPSTVVNINWMWI